MGKVTATPFPKVIRVRSDYRVAFARFVRGVVRSNWGDVVVSTQYRLWEKLCPHLCTVFAIDARRCTRIISTGAFRGIRLLVRPFAVTTFAFKAGGNAMPRVNACGVVKFSITGRLSVNVSLGGQVLHELENAYPRGRWGCYRRGRLFLRVVDFWTVRGSAQLVSWGVVLCCRVGIPV